MARYTGLALLLIGAAGIAAAGGPSSAPKIDPTMGISALGLLVIRARKKRQQK